MRFFPLIAFGALLSGCASIETAPEPIYQGIAEYSCPESALGVFSPDGSSENALKMWQDVLVGDPFNGPLGQTSSDDPHIFAREFATVALRDPVQMRNMPSAGTQLPPIDYGLVGNTGVNPHPSQQSTAASMTITESEILFSNSLTCIRIKNGALLPPSVRRALGESVP